MTTGIRIFGVVLGLVVLAACGGAMRTEPTDSLQSTHFLARSESDEEFRRLASPWFRRESASRFANVVPDGSPSLESAQILDGSYTYRAIDGRAAVVVIHVHEDGRVFGRLSTNWAHFHRYQPIGRLAPPVLEWVRRHRDLYLASSPSAESVARPFRCPEAPGLRMVFQAYGVSGYVRENGVSFASSRGVLSRSFDFLGQNCSESPTQPEFVGRNLSRLVDAILRHWLG
jgi:hypothetical protein